MSVDWTKPIQTRRGRKARLLHTMLHPRVRQPYLCVIDEGTEEEEFFRVSENGSYVNDDGLVHHSDIINVPEEQQLAIVTVFGSGACRFHPLYTEWADDKKMCVVRISRFGDDVKAVVEKVGT